MRTAKTPAFSSGRGVKSAISPAANTRGSVSVCRCSLTWMKPCALSARPVDWSQAGPPACVTQSVSSASKVRPSRVLRQPGETCTTSAWVCRAILRARITRSKRWRTPALCVGRIVSPAVSSTKWRSCTGRPSARSSACSRYCRASTISTPPAPPPTTATVRWPRCAGHWRTLSSRASQRWLNWAMGLTGTARLVAPLMCSTLGVEPMLIDSRS